MFLFVAVSLLVKSGDYANSKFAFIDPKFIYVFSDTLITLILGFMAIQFLIIVFSYKGSNKTLSDFTECFEGVFQAIFPNLYREALSLEDER
jgi:hypothetical protein